MANTKPKLKQPSFGLAYRSEWLADIFNYHHEIDFLEIVADHFIDVPATKIQELKLLQQYFTLIPHGLGLSIGGLKGINKSYLKAIHQLILQLNPPYWSEHLCYTQSGAWNAETLVPLVRSQFVLQKTIENIHYVADTVKIPLILENITHMVQPVGAEMSEIKFINVILEETEVDLLLDLTNLYINSQNYRQNALEFLMNLPIERVKQFHLAGGHIRDGFLIDSHSSAIPQPIWDLYCKAIERFPNAHWIIERDVNIPSINLILDELRQAKHYHSQILS